MTSRAALEIVKRRAVERAVGIRANARQRGRVLTPEEERDVAELTSLIETVNQEFARRDAEIERLKQ